MNSNLTPEKRLDKNGRLVTRHVLSAGIDTLQRALPSPTLPQAPSEAQKTAETVLKALHTEEDGALTRPDGTPQGSSMDNMSQAFVNTFSPRTLEIAVGLTSKGLRRHSAAWKALSGLLSCCERPSSLPLMDPQPCLIVEANIERARIIDIAGIDREIDEYRRESPRAKLLLQRSGNQAQDLIVRLVRSGYKLPDSEYEQMAQHHDLTTAFLMVNAVSMDHSKQFVNDSVFDSYDQLMKIFDARDEVLPHFDEMMKRGSIDLGLLDTLSESAYSLRDGAL